MNIQLFQSVWNILMRIRRGWRDQAPNQNQNQNHQQQNGVARAGSDMMGSGSSQPDVVVVTNDLTDSDNWTAARLLQQLRREGKLNCKIVWIVEPRQVLLGVAISEADQLTCRGLIEKYFLQNMEKSSRPKESLKRLLRGSLTRDEIDNTVDDLDDRKMLYNAIRPDPGTKEDALLHARLMAYDFLEFLRSSPGGFKDDGVDVFVYEDTLDTTEPAVNLKMHNLHTLDKIQMPVNLKVHHPEELISRSREELEEHKAIMQEESLDTRTTLLRKWYRQCIDTQREVCDRKEIRTLRLVLLRQTIRQADRPLYLGGSSMRLLQQLLEKRNVTNKLTCCFQAGTFNLANNLFSNQFNIAMNPNAAKQVFERVDQFRKFYVVPTDTTLDVKYSLKGLGERDRALERRCLGFNYHVDPESLAQDDIRLAKCQPKDVVMADLTAFLCAIQSFLSLPHGIPREKAIHKPAAFTPKQVLQFEPDGKIEAYQIEGAKPLVLDLVKLLFGENESGKG
ncbi:uncharacterized protein E0L32_009074 [Thyridium curvatum]|uniref:Uncharacterized protein n=1 Tax=Thyridium curvatum TaxID=1093900 RepID=A0A507AI33_9PEZI|nr:uncharacterized protein E0L32_009074 [Thyridium curvatum]TPX09735.1 hypothetical protein E0L32_009074 [Thyridium curvatum]